MNVVVIPLIFAALGVGFAFAARLRGFAYFGVSLAVSAGAFFLLFWRDLPFGSTLASPEGPPAVAVYQLFPFIVLFYVPLNVGYFLTRLIRRRYCDRASPI